MSIDEVVDAVKIFLDFLDICEYAKPVRLVVIDPNAGENGAIDLLNAEGRTALLDDFKEWLYID